MKLFLLLAAVACAAAIKVCIPNPFQVDVQEWTNVHHRYEFVRVILDVNKKAMRRSARAYWGNHRPGEDDIFDVLVLASQNKIFEVKGVYNQPDSFVCTVRNEHGIIDDPCVTQNGTHLRTDVIGHTTVDAFYGEDRHGGQTVFSDFKVTSSGIPVQWSTWNMLAHTERVFENFTQTLPANAFSIPKECSSFKEISMTPVEMKQYIADNKLWWFKN